MMYLQMFNELKTFSLEQQKFAEDVTYKAYMMPGMYPRQVSTMLISRSAPQPRSRKTPRGGRMMAAMILMMSLLVCSH